MGGSRSLDQNGIYKTWKRKAGKREKREKSWRRTKTTKSRWERQKRWRKKSKRPPPYADLTPKVGQSNTRSRNPGGQPWSKTLGKVFSPEPAKPLSRTSPEDTDLYPMIEAANTNAWEENRPTMLVYRTWNQQEIRKALEGISSHKDNIGKFSRQMQDLIRSYHLNGVEV